MGKECKICTWVWWSSPVTIFPTVRSAGMITEGEGCLKNKMKIKLVKLSSISVKKFQAKKTPKGSS